MKFSLAILAAGASAIQISGIEDCDDNNENLSDFTYEECSGLYWQAQYNPVTEAWDYDGFWYTDPDTVDDQCDDFWVTLEEYATWSECWDLSDENCDNEWFTTPDGTWREACEDEVPEDACGWVYWDEDESKNYWWTCEDYEMWQKRNGLADM